MSLCPAWACLSASEFSCCNGEVAAPPTSLERPLIRCVPLCRYANCLALHLLASRSTAELFGAGASLFKHLFCSAELVVACMSRAPEGSLHCRTCREEWFCSASAVV